MSTTSKKGPIDEVVGTLHNLLFCVTEDELNKGTEYPPMPNGDEDDRDGSYDGGDGGSYNGIDAGKRTERWFDNIEDKIEKNKKRSTQNQNVLIRVDQRTVWMIRLMVGLMVTIGGGVGLEYLLV